jgi:hypothetical protein
VDGNDFMSVIFLEEIQAMARGMNGRVWEVREKLGLKDWAERNIVISPDESADYAGPYRADMVLPVVRFFEEFLDGGHGERWREFYGVKPSQAAFSTTALIGMTRHVEYSPANAIYAIDSEKSAVVMRDRFVSLLRGAESMGKILQGCSENDLKGLGVSLPGMHAWFVGAGSVGDMAMKPGVKLVIVDETDVHKTPKNEPGTLALLRDRTKATSGGKFMAFCKPTTEAGQIWKPMLEGSQHRDFLPCPHCGVMQYLMPDGLRYLHLTDHHGEIDLAKVLRGTEYECRACGRGISEKFKQEILFAGEARPTNFVVRKDAAGIERQVPGWKEGVMSVRHNDLYAMWPGSGWGNIAAEKVAARNDPMKLRALVTGRFGEIWKQGAARRVQVEDILEMAKEGPEYQKAGAVPFEPASIFCLADTQGDAWKATMMIFDQVGNAAVMDWGYFLAWEDLVNYARAGVLLPDGRRHPCNIALVDEGGTRTFQVRQNCSRLYPIFHPIKGAGGKEIKEPLRWADFGIYKDGGESGPTVRVLVYEDSGFKYLLYRQIILGRKRAAPDAPKLFFPRDVSEDYAREFSSEHFEKVNGKWVWVREHAVPNDFGDTVKEGFICWSEFGALMRKGWSGLEWEWRPAEGVVR